MLYHLHEKKRFTSKLKTSNRYIRQFCAKWVNYPYVLEMLESWWQSGLNESQVKLPMISEENVVNYSTYVNCLELKTFKGQHKKCGEMILKANRICHFHNCMWPSVHCDVWGGVASHSMDWKTIKFVSSFRV